MLWTIWGLPSRYSHTLANTGASAGDGHSHANAVQGVTHGNQFAGLSSVSASLLLVVVTSSLLKVELHVKPGCKFALPLDRDVFRKGAFGDTGNR